LFGFVKTEKMFGAVCYVKEQNGLAKVWIFAYRIKTSGSGHTFSQCHRLQIEAMVWFVCATSS